GKVDEALLLAAQEHGLDTPLLRRTWVRTEKLAFHPETRLMASLHMSSRGEVTTLVKGAPEVILPRVRALGRGAARPFGAKEQGLAAPRVGHHGRRGCQGIAVASRPGHDPLQPGSFEGNLVLLGLIALHDPPRMNARREVRALSEAGLKVVLASGD